jgi:hypothetical protein
MKRIIITLFLLLAAVNLFALVGTVQELNGTVELKNPGSADFVPANTGDHLTKETVISTGFRSSALIQVGSTIITVRPLTRLTLTELNESAGTETLNVNLQAGRVRVDVNPPAGTRAFMSVSSPNATASVRGTSFEMDSRNIKVNHGSVGYQGRRGRSKNVKAGFNSQVENNGRSADPVERSRDGMTPRPPVGSDSSSANTLDSGPSGGSGTFDIIIVH